MEWYNYLIQRIDEFLVTKVDPLIEALVNGDKHESTMPNESSSPILPTPQNPDVLYPTWDSKPYAYHNVRVVCDQMGLTLYEKDLITACITIESNFNTQAVHPNTNDEGVVLSTDYGICQINDYYHIGNGKDFKSIDYVLQNPQACVVWMINMYKAGRITMWVSYTSGAYLKYMPNRAV